MMRFLPSKRHVAILPALLLTCFLAHAQGWGTEAAAATAPGEKPLLIAVSGKDFANIHHGKPVGVIAEAIEHVARQSGFTTRYILMSEREMMPKLLSGEVAIGGALLLGKDSPRVRYSQVLLREYNVLIVRRDQYKQVRNLADLEGLTLGGRLGFSYQQLDNYDEITLKRHEKDGENIRALFLNKIDMAIVASISDLHQFNSEGVMGKLAVLDRAVGYVDLGVAFSVAALGEDKIGKFRQDLANLLVSPHWQQILGYNGVDSLVREWPMIATGSTGKE